MQKFLIVLIGLLMLGFMSCNNSGTSKNDTEEVKKEQTIDDSKKEAANKELKVEEGLRKETKELGTETKNAVEKTSEQVDKTVENSKKVVKETSSQIKKEVRK